MPKKKKSQYVTSAGIWLDKDPARLNVKNASPTKYETNAKPSVKSNNRFSGESWQDAYAQAKMDSLREVALKRKPSKRR